MVCRNPNWDAGDVKEGSGRAGGANLNNFFEKIKSLLGDVIQIHSRMTPNEGQNDPVRNPQKYRGGL